MDDFCNRIKDFNERRRGQEVRMFINTDGSESRPETGRSGGGYVIVLETEVAVDGETRVEWDTVGRTFALGELSNHGAEYEAATRALAMARDLGATNVVLRSDSKLLVDQMTGKAEVKSDELRPLRAKLQEQIRLMGEGNVELRRVNRKDNRTADRLASDGQAKNK